MKKVGFTPSFGKSLTIRKNLAHNAYAVGSILEETPRETTDGLLHYDTKHNRVYYVSYFSGNVMVLDTSLNLIKKDLTIDSIETSLIVVKPSDTAKGTSISNIGPANLVNRESCIDNGILYNLSHIKSSSDNEETFSGNAVVDMYDLKDFTYVRSFMIPKIGQENCRRFRVFGDTLFAIYATHIVSYKI